MIGIRLAALAIGYLFGTFQTGYIYGKCRGIDIREHGSGNAGTTNTLRTLGWKAGLITFLGDSFKAIFAVIAVGLLFGDKYPETIKLLELYAGFGTVLGHNFPFYLKFKGGKGIACTAGVILAVCPMAVSLCIIVFAGAVLITRYVSLGSILVVSIFFIQSVIFSYAGFINLKNPYLIEFNVLVFCFTMMGIWRHRANIKRLMNGTESKFGQKAK